MLLGETDRDNADVVVEVVAVLVQVVVSVVPSFSLHEVLLKEECRKQLGQCDSRRVKQ